MLCVDLARCISREKTHLYDVVHCNKKGSEYVAGINSEELESWEVFER